MILTRLTATNFMKFRELELTGLPKQGLIGILGQNETGKSTIGEAIAFALFGRTLHVPGVEGAALGDGAPGRSGTTNADGADLIRWGEDFAEVELCFELPGRGEFRIFREIDRLGEHLAQLEDLTRGRAISGSYRVARELGELLGYSFADFRDSVYLGQGEVDRLQHAGVLEAAVDRMSGIRVLTRAMEKAARRVTELSGARAEVELALVLERRRAGAIGASGTPGGEGGSRDSEEEERRLFAEITELEAQARDSGARLEAVQEQVARCRDRIFARRGLVDGCDRLLAAARAREISAEIGALTGAMRRELEALPSARAAAATRAASARIRLERFVAFRRLADRLEARVAARLEEIRRRLAPGRRSSLAEERFYTAAEAVHIANRGRAAMGVGVLLMVCGGLGAIVAGIRLPFLHVPPLIGDAVARHLPEQFPTVCGLSLFTGLLLFFFGRVRHAKSREDARVLEREVEAIDRHIAKLEAERQLLAERNRLALLRRGQIELVNDAQLREIAAEIARDCDPELLEEEVASLDAAVLEGAVREEERRLEELVAVEERVNRDLVAAARCRHTLEWFVPEVEPAPEEDEENTAPGSDGAPAGEPQTPAARAPRVTPPGGAAHPSDIRGLSRQLARLASEVGELERRMAEGKGSRPSSASPPSLADRLVPLRPLVEQLSRGSSPPPATRLGELEELVAGGSRSLRARELSKATGALLASLPAAQELLREMQELSHEERSLKAESEKLTGKLEAKQAEFKARCPDFERRREAAEELEGLESRYLEVTGDLECEELARELLEGAVQQLRSRIGPHLARAVGRALERITGGRYSRVNIGPDLQMMVYSDEKNAFVEPVELSGGTHSQVMLALRLGFAEVLLMAKGLRGGHFLFLDEPLGGLDARRTAGFIGLLREFAPTFGQILITATDLSLAPAFDLPIRIDRSLPELRVQGGADRARLTEIEF